MPIDWQPILPPPTEDDFAEFLRIMQEQANRVVCSMGVPARLLIPEPDSKRYYFPPLSERLCFQKPEPECVALVPVGCTALVKYERNEDR